MKNADSFQHGVSPRDSDRGPLWVPYTPPPETVTMWERATLRLRHHAFALVCAVLLIGLTAFFALTPLGREAPPPEASPREAALRADDPAAGSSASDRLAPDRSIPPESPVADHQAGQSGMLMVRSYPDGAAVWVDGDSLGVTPLVRRDVALGSHTLTMQKDGYLRQDTTFVVRRAPASRLAVALQRDTSPPQRAKAPAPRVAVHFRSAPEGRASGRLKGLPVSEARSRDARSATAQRSESAIERQARLKRYIREAETQKARRQRRLRRYIREAERQEARRAVRESVSHNAGNW